MNIKNQVLKTVIYHDLFDYPLKKEEIYKFLVGSKATKKSLESNLMPLLQKKTLETFQGYYFLKGRKKIVTLRKKREIYSQKKIKYALLYSIILKVVPTVKLVGVSGSLSMLNCKDSDDIDLVIITKKGSLWTTRLLCHLVLYSFKRKPNKKAVKNKACLNLFLDESNLEIQSKNLYTAHEVSQLRILWDRGVYSKFINENKWIEKYLPNWEQDSKLARNNKRFQKKRGLVAKQIVKITNFVEKFSKNVQLKYMASKITSERIGDHQLFFHPSGTNEWVLKKYNLRLKKLIL